MRFDVITLFPEMFDSLTKSGITGRACEKEIYSINTLNPRKYTEDKRKTVDDRPYGGGPGMVMILPPLVKAIKAVKAAQLSVGINSHWIVMLSPKGKTFNQEMALKFSKLPALTFLCGRYEGIDERIHHYIDEEISIGDFVLSGGELPAMIVMDAIIRLLPNALGHSQSVIDESFSEDLLDYPHYTRPEEYENKRVPSVLLSGDHAKIKCWRQEKALEATQKNRPDLFEKYSKK